MTDRELDAKVAGLTGWKLTSDEHFARPPEGGAAFIIPHYTTNAGDDYDVLKWVRENWDDNALARMSQQLYQIWLKRDPAGSRGENAKGDKIIFWLPYEPGDYSRAAITAGDEG